MNFYLQLWFPRTRTAQMSLYGCRIFENFHSFSADPETSVIWGLRPYNGQQNQYIKSAWLQLNKTDVEIWLDISSTYDVFQIFWKWLGKLNVLVGATQPNRLRMKIIMCYVVKLYLGTHYVASGSMYSHPESTNESPRLKACLSAKTLIFQTLVRSEIATNDYLGLKKSLFRRCNCSTTAVGIVSPVKYLAPLT